MKKTIELKYRIEEHLSYLSEIEKKEFYRKMDINGIPYPTIRQWVRIGINDKQQIGSESLDKIAAALNVTTEELKNYKTQLI